MITQRSSIHLPSHVSRIALYVIYTATIRKTTGPYVMTNLMLRSLYIFAYIPILFFLLQKPHLLSMFLSRGCLHECLDKVMVPQMWDIKRESILRQRAYMKLCLPFFNAFSQFLFQRGYDIYRSVQPQRFPSCGSRQALS